MGKLNRMLLALVLGTVSSVFAADALPGTLFMTESPAKASNVAELKTSAKEGEDVTLRGQVGGQVKDVFNASRAMMMVADMKLVPCNKIPGDNCATPWDFCCVPNAEKKASIVIVQVVDEKGKLVKAPLKGANGLDHLSVVVVKGKVASNKDGNLIVNASGIYLESAGK